MTETFLELAHDARLLCATGGLEPFGLRIEYWMSQQRSMDAPVFLASGSVHQNWIGLVSQTTHARHSVF